MSAKDLYNGNDPRDIPNYTYQEAAGLSGVFYNTLRSWVKGRHYPRRDGTGFFAPLINLPDPNVPLLSYTNVIEAHVLWVIRNLHGLELKKVRNAIEFMKEQFGREHPLADQQFKTDGIDIFIDHLSDKVLNASRGGQLAFREIIEERLTRVEYNNAGKPLKLFPLIRNPNVIPISRQPRCISVNPEVAFGKPVIAGTAVPIANIADRYQAGDSIATLAADFQLKENSIEEAIRYMLKAA